LQTSTYSSADYSQCLKTNVSGYLSSFTFQHEMMFCLTAQLKGLLPPKFLSHKHEVTAFSLTSQMGQTSEGSLSRRSS